MYKGFKLKDLNTIEIDDIKQIGEGSSAIVYAHDLETVIKVFNGFHLYPDLAHMTADIRREFIIQSRAYMAGMDVAQPYEICRVKVGNYSPIHLGIVMEDLGRLTVDEADDSHLEEHDHICPEYHSFCDNERLMASDVGISTSDTHMKNAMVLSDGGIKRIDLGRWGYADRQKARMASGGNPLRTPLKS